MTLLQEAPEIMRTAIDRGWAKNTNRGRVSGAIKYHPYDAKKRSARYYAQKAKHYGSIH